MLKAEGFVALTRGVQDGVSRALEQHRSDSLLVAVREVDRRKQFEGYVSRNQIA